MKGKETFNILSDSFKNVPTYAKKLVEYTQGVAKHYHTNQVPIFYGGDFAHVKA